MHCYFLIMPVGFHFLHGDWYFKNNETYILIAK